MCYFLVNRKNSRARVEKYNEIAVDGNVMANCKLDDRPDRDINKDRRRSERGEWAVVKNGGR